MYSIATEIVTPPLDGMILPGVTRDSVLTLARDHASGKAPLEGMPEGKIVVNERPVTMQEVKNALAKGQLVEFFGTGACSAWHIKASHVLSLHCRYRCGDQPRRSHWLPR
jgi:branched-subunit amino acid aminotransferase/4-amino-4-deoxychorismate lyase